MAPPEESYLYIPQVPGQAEISVKKSTFIAQVHPWQSSDEIKPKIQALKAEHYKARHVAWACVVGKLGQQTPRFSDDGEPQGTAGRPILDILQKQNRTNVLVTVVRYFGGIKLGTGGLVKAYSEAAKLAIEATEWEALVERVDFQLVIGYELWPVVEPTLKQWEVVVLDTAFTDEVQVTGRMVESTFGAFKTAIVDLCHGRVRFVSV